MIMAVKDAHLKLVDVVAFANVDNEVNVTKQLVKADSFVTASLQLGNSLTFKHFHSLATD